MPRGGGMECLETRGTVDAILEEMVLSPSDFEGGKRFTSRGWGGDSHVGGPAWGKDLPGCLALIRLFSDSWGRAGLGARRGLLMDSRTGECWVIHLASLDPLTVLICHISFKNPSSLVPLRAFGISKAMCGDCIFRTPN